MIYVDLVFLINLVYDYLILNSVNIILRRNINQKRIFLGSLIGTISSFGMFIPVLNNIYVTVLISILMVLITFRFKDIIYFKNNFIYFYMISIIFGGFLYLLNLKFNHSYNFVDEQNYKIFLNFIGIIIIAPIITLYYLYTYKNFNVNNKNYYDLKFSIKDKLYQVKAFYDTGNLIKDPYKGRPVVLINKEILKCDIKNKSPIYVPCKMVNNSFLIECYKPTLLIINDKVINNCLIGLWNNKFLDGINGIISGYIGDKIK